MSNPRAYTVAAWQRDFARAFAAGITLECSPTRARGVLLLADNDEPELTADMVRSMVAAKWPGLLDSPLAQAMHGASSMARLEASDADDAIARHEHEQMRSAALEHALACMWACDGWTVETLSNNIESAFGMDLDGDECDDIARQALGNPEDEPDDEPLTCIGCNGSEVGILYRAFGQRELRKLTVSAAATGAETATVTLNSQSRTVALTSGTKLCNCFKQLCKGSSFLC